MVSGPVQMVADRVVDFRLGLGFQSFRRAPPRPSQADRVKVRRSLFGPPPPGELMEFVRKEQEALHRRDCQRWNFDFKNETPLPPGPNQRWEWTRVEEPRPSADPRLTPETVTHDQNETVPCAAKTVEKDSPSRVNNEEQNAQSKNGDDSVRPVKALYRQTSIDDYMKAKRKRNLSVVPLKHDPSPVTQPTVPDLPTLSPSPAKKIRRMSST